MESQESIAKYNMHFEISLDKLQLKTSITSTKRKFKFNIKNLVQENNFPDCENRIIC